MLSWVWFNFLANTHSRLLGNNYLRTSLKTVLFFNPISVEITAWLQDDLSLNTDLFLHCWTFPQSWLHQSRYHLNVLQPGLPGGAQLTIYLICCLQFLSVLILLCSHSLLCPLGAPSGTYYYSVFTGISLEKWHHHKWQKFRVFMKSLVPNWWFWIFRRWCKFHTDPWISRTAIDLVQKKPQGRRVAFSKSFKFNFKVSIRKRICWLSYSQKHEFKNVPLCYWCYHIIQDPKFMFKTLKLIIMNILYLVTQFCFSFNGRT